MDAAHRAILVKTYPHMLKGIVKLKGEGFWIVAPDGKPMKHLADLSAAAVRREVDRAQRKLLETNRRFQAFRATVNGKPLAPTVRDELVRRIRSRSARTRRAAIRQLVRLGYPAYLAVKKLKVSDIEVRRLIAEFDRYAGFLKSFACPAPGSATAEAR